MAAVLDAEYGSVEEAAAAALAEAERIFAFRANFTVVGQLVGRKGRISIPTGDPEAIKLALGWFSTEGDARAAAESLWLSAASGDRFAVWVLPVHHGTPADLHNKRKEQYQATEAKARDAARERIKLSIAKRQREAEIRAAGGKGACECSHQSYDHLAEGSSRGRCGLTECECPKWRERRQ